MMVRDLVWVCEMSLTSVELAMIVLGDDTQHVEKPSTERAADQRLATASFSSSLCAVKVLIFSVTFFSPAADVCSKERNSWFVNVWFTLLKLFLHVTRAAHEAGRRRGRRKEGC